MGTEKDQKNKCSFIFDGCIKCVVLYQRTFCNVFHKDHAEKAISTQLISNIFPPCDDGLTSPCLHRFTRSAGNCQPRWFVNTHHLSITLPSIPTSLGIAEPGCSVMCLTIQQDRYICHSLICYSACPTWPAIISQRWNHHWVHQSKYMEPYACINTSINIHVYTENDSHRSDVMWVKQKWINTGTQISNNLISPKYQHYTIYNPLNHHTVS